MKSETAFWKNVVERELRLIPGLWYKKIQQASIRGTPDVLLCYKGHFIAWEMKVPPNKVKPGSLQEHNLRSIKNAGGIAREVNPQNFEECLEELLCLVGLRASSPQSPPLPL